MPARLAPLGQCGHHATALLPRTFFMPVGCKAFVRIRTHAACGRTFARNFVRTVISFSRPAPAPCYSTILGRGDLPRYAESGVLQRIRGDLSPPSSTRSPRLDNARTFQRRHRDNARHIQGSRQAASRRAIRKARRRKPRGSRRHRPPPSATKALNAARKAFQGRGFRARRDRREPRREAP